MRVLPLTAFAVLVMAWAGYAYVFISNARRIKRQRRERPETEAQRKSIPEANWGIALQCIGFYLGTFRRPNEISPDALLLLAITLAPWSLWLGWLAIRELGVQWRIQAVVTGTHKLITTGPYRWVRHPVYTSLLGMLLASSFVFSTWKFTIPGVALYVIGTEIRIAAEERLLAERFGREFSEFRARVPAYIPFLR